MVTEANWNFWKKEDFKVYMDFVIESFGTERIMFGSDWPGMFISSFLCGST
jgi:L-fuconolactonase